MAFSYAPSLEDDVSRVRFEVGDTTESEAYLSDEEIRATLDAADGNVGTAAIHCCEFILRKLNKPNFKADWLEIDYQKARNGVRQTLLDLRRRYSGGAASGAEYGYRVDSQQRGGRLTEYSDNSGGV